MAKRERNKRAARKARQAERERLDAIHATTEPAEKKDSKSFFKKSDSKPAKSAKAGSIAKADRKGMAKVTGYFSDVRSEMRQVTWPSRNELRSYSIAVIAMLIVFGIAIWAIDTGFVAGLVKYTGLRG